MVNLSEIEALTKPIEGYLSQFEGEVLYHLAFKSRGKIVEIGSWKGKSTIWLGKGSDVGRKQQIYAIDPHTDAEEVHSDGESLWTFEAFKENISHADIAKYVIPIVKHPLESLQDVPGRVGMLFIDGTYDYETVKEEFDAWLPKIKLGGTIAFHDSFGHDAPGVRQLVHEELFLSSAFKDVRYINGITYATKIEQATAADRIKNRFALLVKLIHETSLELPQPFRSLAKRLIWRPFQRRWLQELEGQKSDTFLTKS